MTQEMLDRLVAKATGEDLGEIQHRGFGLFDHGQDDGDPGDWEEDYIDWDALEKKRNVAVVMQRFDRQAA